MRVATLALEDFRNFVRQQTGLGAGINLIVGRNAQGKTNLLEAVHCLSGLGSPRGPDHMLVRSGAERAVLHADVVRGPRHVRVDLEIRPGRGNRALLNGNPVPSPRALAEVCSSVFFGPDELSLVKGSPEGRRRFLDDLVVGLRPARETLRREWERILRQRNALLRSMPRERGAAATATATLEVWDEALCRVGAELTAARLEVLAELAPYAAKRYEAVAGGGRLELAYASTWAPAGEGNVAALQSALQSALQEARERELERRVSLVGPQRDDVVVMLVSAGDPAGEARDARAYASQGDQRTCALALKLGEHDLLSDATGEQPVLLLDDVFSELDPARRRWLGGAVAAVDQTVLTSAEPDALDIGGVARVIEVRAGELRDAQ